MPHELTEIDGEHAFVYNQERGNPWHRLGMPIQGDMTAQGALRFSRSNDTVELQPVYVLDEDGDVVLVPGVAATVSDIYGPMAVVGENWEVKQRSEMMELAYTIAGLAGEDAHVDTMGNLGPQGQTFFAYVRFEEWVLDPQGVADTIDRGLFVGTSFDGTMANTFGYSLTRPVCKNTVRFALDHLKMAVKIKHTAGSDERTIQAAEALGYAGAVERQMKAKAEALLAVENPPLAKTLEAIWPTEDLDDDNPYLKRREDIQERIWDLYLGPLNAELVGKNGWAAYNAITEWIDHERPVRLAGDSDAKQQRRFQQALVDTDYKWNQTKARAAELLLA